MSQEHAFYRSKTFNRRKIWLMFLAVFFVLMFLGGRLVYLMVFCSEYYGQKAEDLHERERDIKAARGRIIDATGKILATNKSVCTISVIHSQIDEPEKVIAALQKELGLTEEEVRKRVEKVSSIERVKTNVDKETGRPHPCLRPFRNQGRRGLQAVLPFGYHGVHGARLYGCG